jgi:hypothetical protein
MLTYNDASLRFATGIVTQIVAGHKIKSADDPYLRMSSMVLESLSRAGHTPAGTAIDFFPFRAYCTCMRSGQVLMIMIGTSVQHFPRWFPGTHYAGVAEEWRPTVRELHDYPVRTVRAQRVTRSLYLRRLYSIVEHCRNRATRSPASCSANLRRWTRGTS